MSIASWDQLPTKGELKERIDAFLRAVHEARFDDAFAICPLESFVQGTGMVIKTGLDAAAIREQLQATMFQFIEAQQIVRQALQSAKADDPTTWCHLITPPAEVDFEDISLDFPFDDEESDVEDVEDAPDSTRAAEDGEVLANVHLRREVTDITGRYALTEHDGRWILTFHNFDIM